MSYYYVGVYSNNIGIGSASSVHRIMAILGLPVVGPVRKTDDEGGWRLWVDDAIVNAGNTRTNGLSAMRNGITYSLEFAPPEQVGSSTL